MKYLGMSALIFMKDLLIKDYVESSCFGEEKKLFGGKLILRRHHNEGAMMNIGGRKVEGIKWISLATNILLVLTLLIKPANKKGAALGRLGTVLMLGGGMSNTYDRFKRGYVVDYLSVGKSRVVFNIADVLIVVGMILSLLGSLAGSGSPKKQKEQELEAKSEK